MGGATSTLSFLQPIGQGFWFLPGPHLPGSIPGHVGDTGDVGGGGLV
jgi:hypothetical protein